MYVTVDTTGVYYGEDVEDVLKHFNSTLDLCHLSKGQYRQE